MRVGTRQRLTVALGFQHAVDYLGALFGVHYHRESPGTSDTIIFSSGMYFKLQTRINREYALDAAHPCVIHHPQRSSFCIGQERTHLK